MNETWWRSAKDVDPDQIKIYSLPPDGRHLVLGPPGSGKTNVALLRAVFLGSSGRANLKFLSFSRSLVEFVRSGVRANGKIPQDRIQTLASWEERLFKDITGKSIELTNKADHDRSRYERNAALQAAIVKYKVPSTYYDALLIDEAQDMLALEVEICSMLSSNLFFVADSRQRIYPANEGIDAIRGLGCSEHALRNHYRIGRKICRAADRILPIEGESLSECAQYDELRLPSSVRVNEYPSRDSQMKAIVDRLETQVRAYPDEWLGVISPTNALLDEFEAYAAKTRIADKLCVHRKGDRRFLFDRPIVALTAHSSKGTEFRAVHIFAAEKFDPWYRREIGFTVVTRAKTAVDCYYTGQIDGSLLAALLEERVADPLEVF